MTNYYNDLYSTYNSKPLLKTLKEKFNKYFVIDAGQLVLGTIGLILMVML